MTAIGKNIEFKMESDTGASVKLDSVDQGEVIAGYKTVHFRGLSTHRMTMNILGAPTAWNVQTTTDYYVAPGFSPDSLELSSSSASKRALEIATASIAPGIKALAARNRSAMERMTKLGTTVKTVTESRISTSAGVRTRIKSTELLAHRTMSVPDSTFLIPAGYTKTLPGFTPVP